jgi:RHS repeat-associated protein
LKSHTSGSTTINYEIDPLQRRMGRLVGTTLSARYMYNPEGQVVGELNNLNRLVKTFVYGTKNHVPDYYVDSSNNKFRIITDNLGSVRLVVSSAGVVSQLMEHDEFGRVLQDTNPGLTPFGFAGGVYDSATGLVRFGARDYDPLVGRWLSKDPIRFDGGDTNLYGYVLQDPINLIDPNGENALIPAIIFGGAAIVIGILPVDEGSIPPPRMFFPPRAPSPPDYFNDNPNKCTQPAQPIYKNPSPKRKG